MAQYTQKVFATDSYEVNWNTGERTGGDILTTMSQYRFTTPPSGQSLGFYLPTKASETELVFPDLIGMNKKKFVGNSYYVFVTDKRAAKSGTLPSSGTFVHALGFSVQGFTTQMENNWQRIYADIETLIAGQYNKVSGRSLAAFGGSTGNVYADRTYTIDNYVKFSSHTTANAPYIIYTYEDIIPFASSHSPSKFLDKKVSNTLQWAFDYDHSNIFGELKQQSAKVRYRNQGAANYTEVTVAGALTACVIPPNTFTANSVEWQVIVTSDDNVQSIQTDWITLTTVDSVPSCKVAYPNDVFIDGSQENTFFWNHIIETGSPQSRFEMQYSVDGETWLGLATEATDRENYTVPANQLAAGTMRWRVRTYNTDGVASEWSGVGSTVVRSAPVAPNLISIDNKARPAIKWGAVGQEAYRLIIEQENKVIYQTGVVSSNKKQMQIPIYLNDGRYQLKLSVMNQYGLESQPVNAAIDVLTSKPPLPFVQCESLCNTIKLSVKENQTMKKVYVLRNGIPVKKMSEKLEWYDYASAGINAYVVRVVDANDNFADSDPINVLTPIKHAVIAPVEDLSYSLTLKHRRDSPVTQSGTVDFVGDSHFFVGREYPVHVFAQQKTANKPLSYTFLKEDDFKSFARLADARQTVLYRNRHGERFYGVITAYEFYRDKYGIDVSFNLQRVNFTEGIEYDI